MENYFSNFNFIRVLIKWKWHLIIIVGLSVLLSAIFSSKAFITPKFKSYAVVYPANISPYSDESETEQMLQIFQSSDIKDRIIEKFGLAKHYKIDPSYKYFYSTLLYELEQNVKISKTPYESVEIEVLDKDPQVACDMVNAFIEFYDVKINSMHKTKIREVMNMYEYKLDEKLGRIDSLKTELQYLSDKYGLLNYESQVTEVTKGHLRTVLGASSTSINTREVEKLRTALNDKGGDILSLVEFIRNETKEYSALQLDYDRDTKFYKSDLTYSNIISKPFPADKKSFPVRWLILVFTAVATLFVSIILVLILDNYKSMIKS